MSADLLEKKRPKLGLRRILILVLAFVVGLTAGVLVAIFVPFTAGHEENIEVLQADLTIVEEEYTLTIENVEELVAPASELVSTKYFYKDADIYENVVSAFGVELSFATDKVVFTYEGVVSLGVNLEDVDFQVDNAQKTIYVDMPAVEIMHNEIDAKSFEYPYSRDSIFNSTGMEDYVELIDMLQTAKAEDVMADAELLEETRLRAEETIRNILMVADASSEYEVVFR